MAKCVIFCLVWVVIFSTNNVKGENLPCKNAKTIASRCMFNAEPYQCIQPDEIATEEEYEDERHFCENGENSYAECSKSCFNDEIPQIFEGPDDPMAILCNSVPMPCQFPFIHNGVQYSDCTNDKLLSSTTESEEDFYWCATHTSNTPNENTMIWWGKCDMSTCENGTPESSEQSASPDSMSAIVNILPESNEGDISGTIDFSQESEEEPLLINGKVSGLTPSGKHGFQIHSNKLIGVDCQSAGDQFNSEDADHGGNIQANEDGIADLEISVTKGWALFGEQNVLDKTLVIYENENDDKRIACGVIMLKEDPNQTSMMTIIIIVLVVIIVLLLILITALIIYCCKRKGQVSKGKGDEVGPYQNGDMKKKPLEYDELSIPFIDASPAPTPKVGRSTDRLSFFNRTPSIGRSRGSLSNEDKATA